VIAGNEAVSRDIPPFAAVRYNALKGYNAVGCRRAGFSRESIHAVRQAYHKLLTIRTIPAAVEAIQEDGNSLLPEVQELLDFIATTKRGIQPSLRFIMYYSHASDGSTSGGNEH
jgi:UDP-N-acetylglucosamine acyltransferase